MTRNEEVQYEQDNLGNERRKIDTLRAQEGMVGGDDADQGIENIGSAETGTVTTLYSLPTHADQVYLSMIQAFNSVGSGANTFSLYELNLDGSGNITGQTKRSVPINVASGATRTLGYEGMEFNKAIGVESEFQGQIGVAVLSDHEEYSEQASEDY